MTNSPTTMPTLSPADTDRIIEGLIKPALELPDPPDDAPLAAVRRTFRSRICPAAAIALGLLAGLRLNEIRLVRTEDVRLRPGPAGTIYVPAEHGHGKRDRYVPMETLLAAILDQAMNARRHLDTDAPGHHLFAAALWHGPPDKRTVSRWIARGTDAALGRKVRPHVLRHTFATNMMRVCDTRIVQELLGHSSITSTQVYTHPNEQDLRFALDRAATARDQYRDAARTAAPA